MPQVTLRDDFSVALQLWDVGSASGLGVQSPSDPQPSSPRPEPTAPPGSSAALSTYLFNAQAVLALYDVTDPGSLEALGKALQVRRKQAGLWPWKQRERRESLLKAR